MSLYVTIFYSWQSDTPFNSKVVRDAIRVAASEVEKQIQGVTIDHKEATSNRTGATHIPNAILENISHSDIFIGDVTPVGLSNTGAKKLPNPNVAIELGYAVAKLDWPRIILCFNKAFGSFPDDLPFDIDRRRTVDFRATIENDTNAVGLLKTELVTLIKAIIESNPVKPTGDVSAPDKAKRDHDVKILRKFLNLFPAGEMDVFFQQGYHSIEPVVVRQWDELKTLMQSKTFHLYDLTAKELLTQFLSMNTVIDSLIAKDFKRVKYAYQHNLQNQQGGPSRYDHSKAEIAKIEVIYAKIIEHLRYNYLDIKITKKFLN